MDPIAIPCSIREGHGKGAARKLRAKGMMPAVVYGHGLDTPVSITIEPKELEKALANPKVDNALMALDLGEGRVVNALVRQVQRQPVTRQIMHLDMYVPNPEKILVAEIPVATTGRAIGVSTGGRLRKPYRKVKVACKPADIPAEVVVDVTELDHNDIVMASELSLPETVKAVYDRDYVVVKVQPPRGGNEEDLEEEEGEAAEGAEGAEA